jgi:hypothetical protein
MNDFDIKSLEGEAKENLIKYLSLLKTEFWEVNDFINSLKKCKPYALDNAEASAIQKALDMAVVISYTRNFKKSTGFEIAKKINNELICDFTGEEIELHNKKKDERDHEFAHSDASAHDVQVEIGELFSFSKRRVRQSLEKAELEMLQNMTTKIRDRIDITLQKLNEER